MTFLRMRRTHVPPRFQARPALSAVLRHAEIPLWISNLSSLSRRPRAWAPIVNISRILRPHLLPRRCDGFSHSISEEQNLKVAMAWTRTQKIPWRILQPTGQFLRAMATSAGRWPDDLLQVVIRPGQVVPSKTFVCHACMSWVNRLSERSTNIRSVQFHPFHAEKELPTQRLSVASALHRVVVDGNLVV